MDKLGLHFAAPKQNISSTISVFVYERIISYVFFFGVVLCVSLILDCAEMW